MAWRVGWGEGREAQKGGALCIIMVDSHCCPAKTNTVHKAISLQLKNKLKINK